jgi:hypothetical protein
MLRRFLRFAARRLGNHRNLGLSRAFKARVFDGARFRHIDRRLGVCGLVVPEGADRPVRRRIEAPDELGVLLVRRHPGLAFRVYILHRRLANLPIRIRLHPDVRGVVARHKHFAK